MANHVRQQCRDRIVALVTGLATSGSNVFTNVVYDIERLSLPAIGVTEGDERRDAATMPAPRIFDVQSDFDVMLYAEDSTDPEAKLDTMSKEVEVALAMPVSGPWKSLTQVSSSIQLEPAEKVRGRRVLRYRAEYRIRENAPDVAL